MAHKTILSPEEPKARVPVSKMTIVVLLGVVVCLALLSTLFTGGVSAEKIEKAPQQEPVAPRKVNTIEEEESKARAKASEPPPLPAEKPVILPDSVKRSDNSAALGDGAKRAGRADSKVDTAQLEIETQVRSAKAMVLDDSEQSLLGGMVGKSLDSDSPSANMPSATAQDAGDRRSTLEKLAERYAAAQTGAVAGGKTWLKEFEAESSKTAKRSLTPYATGKKPTLHQGKIIPAVLGRAINSDLPGRITAHTTLDIYDSLGRGQLLIPKGSMLDGRYDSDVKVGQERILFAFERLIMPNGDSFDLPAANGSDLSGAAGIGGDVNNHFFKMFASSLFIAVLADRTGTKQASTNIGTTGITDAAGQVLSDTSKVILERNRVIQPTITVDQGTRINVEVVADMVFPSAYPKN